MIGVIRTLIKTEDHWHLKEQKSWTYSIWRQCSLFSFQMKIKTPAVLGKSVRIANALTMHQRLYVRDARSRMWQFVCIMKPALGKRSDNRKCLRPLKLYKCQSSPSQRSTRSQERWSKTTRCAEMWNLMKKLQELKLNLEILNSFKTTSI